MDEQDPGQASPLRTYEKRQHRHRQLYWRALLPIFIVLAAGYAADYFQESLMLAALGVLVVMLVMLREIIDLLGYLGCVQRDAADDREAIRHEMNELKERISPRKN